MLKQVMELYDCELTLECQSDVVGFFAGCGFKVDDVTHLDCDFVKMATEKSWGKYLFCKPELTDEARLTYIDTLNSALDRLAKLGFFKISS